MPTMTAKQNIKSSKAEFLDISAPPAPPLPPQHPGERVSGLALKVRNAPPGWAFEGHVNQPGWDAVTPPVGMYFFYGTLQDPGILSEVLQTDRIPILKPARVIGYALKLWGQYPAMVDGPGGDFVHGSMFEVEDEVAAGRLQDYETKAYRTQPCLIRVSDNGGEEELVEGYTFVYAGNPVDLGDGTFDLDIWLRRMGRRRKD